MESRGSAGSRIEAVDGLVEITVGQRGKGGIAGLRRRYGGKKQQTAKNSHYFDSGTRDCYTNGLLPQISRAGEWFLHSGIQEANGGVARYHRVDVGRNAAISTEITGYAASALVYLHSLTHDDRYLDRATAA